MREQSRSRFILTSILCSMFIFTVGLLYCSPGYCDSEGEEEEIQTHENPMTYKVNKKVTSQQGHEDSEMLYVNDGEGPGGDRPSPGIQQIRPSVPAQTMRPSVPAQTMRPSAPAQTMRPSAPTQKMRPSGPVQ